MNTQARVVVVGAGFGGLYLVRALARAPVEIALIDRNNHHLFQPLLYQVATAALSAVDIAIPTRRLFRGSPNVTVLMDEVEGVDTTRHTVTARSAGNIPYDFLVLATGCVYSWFGHQEWSRYALVLKSLKDAEQVRERLLGAFEIAEGESDPREIARLTSVVVVGGGATGVELAGAIAELVRSMLARDFRHLSATRARVLLIEAAGSLLAGFPRPLQDYTRRALERLGVEVQTGVKVQQIDARGVVAGDERIEAATVLWCAGVRATPVATWLGVSPAPNGGAEVAGDCSVPGFSNIFAIGDASFMHDAAGRRMPGLAVVAKQQGRYVADVIARRIAGREPPAPFRYRDMGELATIGRSAAVAVFRVLRLKGLLAWLLWGLVHLYFLIGMRNRMAVFLNWVWAWVTYDRGARVILDASAVKRITENVDNSAPARTALGSDV